MKNLLIFVVGVVVMFVLCFGILYVAQVAGYVSGLP